MVIITLLIVRSSQHSGAGLYSALPVRQHVIREPGAGKMRRAPCLEALREQKREEALCQ